MSTFAAVMTGKGTGAIATIQIFGDKAEEAIKKIFKPAGNIYALGKPLKLEPGKILLGKISDNSRTIDKLTIGCEDTNNIAIHCHGNPLIVADIMKLLAKHNVKLITNTELLVRIAHTDKSLNSIAIEAKLARITAKTLRGTKIIANQIKSGLTKKASEWLADELSLEKLKAEAAEVLRNSDIAKPIIEGCTIVLAGPPNSGKSTLLNYVAGKEKAIVTDIKGTTRDHVTATCHIGPLLAEIIDTAGLDEQLSSHIEKESQKTAAQLLQKADIILLVLDASEPIQQLNDNIIKKITTQKTITVLNKSDLAARLDTSKLPKVLSDTIPISAKTGDGIENLLKKIRDITAIDSFDIKTPVCFTSRQESLLKKLTNTNSKDTASEIITELLNGSLGV